MSNSMPERDFSRAKCTAQVPALARIQAENATKERITIRLDTDILAWFRAHVSSGGNYQSMINSALRSHIEAQDGVLESTLRRVLREELRQVA